MPLAAPLAASEAWLIDFSEQESVEKTLISVKLVILCPRIISSLIQVFRGICEWSWGLCHHSPLLSVVLYRGQISLLHFSLQYFDISWKNRHCYLDSGRIFILSLAFYAAPPFSFSLPLPSFFPLCFWCAWMCLNVCEWEGTTAVTDNGVIAVFPLPSLSSSLLQTFSKTALTCDNVHLFSHPVCSVKPLGCV